MSKVKDKILSVLKADARLWNEDMTELNQTLLLDLVESIDEAVINLLLGEEELRAKFFVKIKDVYVFKTNDFRFFMEENKVDNSYTAYKNKIGLTDGKKFLKYSSDVVLDFPFKDCILEGGQSTEEGTDTYFEYSDKTELYEQKEAKRKEVFFNQVLAKDEIDRLLDPKALVNWKRFTKDGEKEVKKIGRDEDGTIRDNLIIKGNNLLALHSLKSEFAGKVKLVYIDPPYNTGGNTETFTYNNSFKHSTWLTFMKNRLDIAKELLMEEGFITMTIDHAELLYLGVLADELFGRDNRIGIVTIVHKPEGRNQEKFFGTSNEFMLVYAKNKSASDFERVILDEELKGRYDNQDEEGLYRLKNFIRLTDGKYSLKENKPHFFYPIYVSPNLEEYSLEKKNNYIEVFPVTDSGVERTWKTTKETFIKLAAQDRIVAKKENGTLVLYEKLREDQVIKTHWIKKQYHAYHFGTKLLEKILGRKEFSYPKSLYSVIDTLKLMTSNDDIILDYHAGSGTTGHATLELNKEDGGNRKFILIEQLNEHINICNERCKKVLEQEKINDSFIYFELAKWNETAKAHILGAKTLEELEAFFDEMCEKYFLNYNLKVKEFKEKVIKEEDFKNLSLDEQKQIFVAMLDNNQMYVNKTEMADKKFCISEADQRLTEAFYNETK
ncbi:site-specific DNA-methyltransferase [Candidatus Nomurabacteria bacterium]|nr:site-specific DNA-methyltransferase [Candidatus Nomurabacteria bacterium]